MGVGSQCHTLAILLPRKRPGTHHIQGSMALGSVWLDAENLAPTRLQTLDHPAQVSHYTNYAIPATLLLGSANERMRWGM
jgi:hypothetical protein